MQAYVVKGTRTVNGKSETVWLAWHEDSGGAFQWTNDGPRHAAHLFKSKLAAAGAARDCLGPWYNEPAKDSIVILEAEYTPPQPATLTIKEG